MKKVLPLLILMIFVFGCNKQTKELTVGYQQYIDLGPRAGCDAMKKDKTNVYFNNEIIIGANAATFEEVDDRHEIMYQDKNAVYYLYLSKDCASQLFTFKDADIETLEILGYGQSPKYENNIYKHYAKDKNHVYHESEILEEVDPATFEVPK